MPTLQEQTERELDVLRTYSGIYLGFNISIVFGFIGFVHLTDLLIWSDFSPWITVVLFIAGAFSGLLGVFVKHPNISSSHNHDPTLSPSDVTSRIDWVRRANMFSFICLISGVFLVIISAFLI